MQARKTLTILEEMFWGKVHLVCDQKSWQSFYILICRCFIRESPAAIIFTLGYNERDEERERSSFFFPCCLFSETFPPFLHTRALSVIWFSCGSRDYYFLFKIRAVPILIFWFSPSFPRWQSRTLSARNRFSIGEKSLQRLFCQSPLEIWTWGKRKK